jgi:hypothetical protein
LVDVWRLDPGESVVIAAKFTDYTGVFMVHCHMLDHEDDGMMAQFAVVKPHTHLLPPGYRLAQPATTAHHAAGMQGMSMATLTRPLPHGGLTGWRRSLLRSSAVILAELVALGFFFGVRRNWRVA